MSKFVSNVFGFGSAPCLIDPTRFSSLRKKNVFYLRNDIKMMSKVDATYLKMCRHVFTDPMMPLVTF